MPSEPAIGVIDFTITLQYSGGSSHSYRGKSLSQTSINMCVEKYGRGSSRHDLLPVHAARDFATKLQGKEC